MGEQPPPAEQAPRQAEGEPSPTPSAGDPHAGWIAVGQIMGAFGQQGDVRVKPLGGATNRFRDLKRVFLGEDHVPADVLHRRAIHPGVVLRLSTVSSRDEARDLFQTYLYVPEAEAVKLPRGRYFVHQIVGLSVVTTEGEALGSVREVLETGSNDVYVVRAPGANSREVLVPALKDVVKRIDLDAGTMEVALPPGLIE
ncbi:MAG TPA: ribosome maturation factor RimM [Chloroflexota bacterium]|nr:ribosome maturation factor RimM [Chloroflexota bacterium]